MIALTNEQKELLSRIADQRNSFALNLVSEPVAKVTARELVRLGLVGSVLPNVYHCTAEGEKWIQATLEMRPSILGFHIGSATKKADQETLKNSRRNDSSRVKLQAELSNPTSREQLQPLPPWILIATILGATSLFLLALASINSSGTSSIGSSEVQGKRTDYLARAQRSATVGRVEELTPLEMDVLRLHNEQFEAEKAEEIKTQIKEKFAEEPVFDVQIYWAYENTFSALLDRYPNRSHDWLCLRTAKIVSANFNVPQKTVEEIHERLLLSRLEATR